MKNPNPLKPATMLSSLVAIALGLVLTTVTAFAQSFWTGGSNDYNNAASWSGPYNSGNPNCCNDSGLANVVLIQPGDPAWFHGDTLAGQGSGASGSYLQTGSTNGTGFPNNGNWLRLGIGGGGAVGYYTLSNGVLNVAGQTHMGENGTGTLEVDGGVFTSGYNGNPGICAGDGDMGPSPVGTLILTGGSITNISNETWFGEGSGTGTLLMSNGTFTVYNWFVFGRNGGNGTGIMTGGTINMIGGGNFLVGGGGNGSLTQSGGTINCNPQFLVPQQNAPGTYTISGSSVLNVHDWLAVGRDGGTGQLTISDSASITRDNNNDGGANFTVGSGGQGTLTQNGGAITNLGGSTFIGETATGEWDLNSGIASLGTIDICEHNGVQGTLNLNGGLLQITGITSPSGAGSFSSLTLNGGILQAMANNIDFISALSQAYVTSAGVIIDSQAFNITVPQALQDSGGGTLTKNGTGTLTLTGANTYAGATTVNAGTLETTTASTGAGSYTVASGAVLSVQVASAGTQLSSSSLTFAGPNTLNIDLNTFGTPTLVPVNVAGALTANGTVIVNVLSSAPVAAGTIPLIQYGSPAGSGTFVLGNIPPGDSGYLTNSGGFISLVITSASEPRWNGNVGGGVWDIGTTPNWIDLISGNPTTYQEGKPVLFDDNATGTTTVNLSTTVNPGSVTFNNSLLPYTLNGSGAISGTTGVVLEGSNTVSLLNTGGNSYTGPTVLDAGTLVVTSLANGGSPSAIGASSSSPTNLVLAGGTLSYTGPTVAINRGYTGENTNGTVDISVAGNLTLSGTVADFPGSGFVKSGPGQLTYAGTGNNALADTLGYSVAQGTVAFAGQTNSVNGNFVVAGPSLAFPLPATSNAALAISSPATLDISFLDVGDSANGTNITTGVVTQTGGTVVAPGGAQIGQFPNGVGIYNLSGGTLTTESWLSVGRQGGVGTFNLSGTGVLIATGGGNFDIGNSGGVGGYSGTGVFNQTGGALTNTTEVWLGEASGEQPDSGTWNMSGGTAVTGEVHVGVGGTGTSTLNVSGSASITESYLLLANYDGNTTGNVNIGSVSQPGGTITVGADMNIGGQGNGTLTFVTNGGGTLTVTGTIYLSRFSQTADGTINLNTGGTLIAGYINNGWGFQNNFSSPTDNPNALNFNGGTLQAYVGSPYFIQPYVNAVVQSSGAIINDGGYSITVLAPLVDGGGGGGLTKLGNGVLYLNGANTYTGATLVTQGAFGIGSSASLACPVTIEAGATLLGDEGAIQTSVINGSLTLNAGSTTGIQITPSSNDEFAGLTSVSYGGALVVTNSGGALTPGNIYQLFNSVNPGTGNFSSVTIVPSGAATFNPANGVLTIVAPTPPTINPPKIVSGNLILTGTGGTAGENYTVLSSTNLTTPLADWITNATGAFSGTGTFSNSIPATNVPAEFFILQVP